MSNNLGRSGDITFSPPTKLKTDLTRHIWPCVHPADTRWRHIGIYLRAAKITDWRLGNSFTMTSTRHSIVTILTQAFGKYSSICSKICCQTHPFVPSQSHTLNSQSHKNDSTYAHCFSDSSQKNGATYNMIFLYAIISHINNNKHELVCYKLACY